jgi:hypothetical protein
MRSLISLIQGLVGRQNAKNLRAPHDPAQDSRADPEAITVRIRRPRVRPRPDVAAIEAAVEAAFWSS